MASDKSKLKTDIMREAPFRAALCLTDDARALCPPDKTGEVRVVVEDASVRFAAGPPDGRKRKGPPAAAAGSGSSAGGGAGPGPTGTDLVQAFLAPVERAFALMPNLHTYVVLFDKKQWVPRQKGATQQGRREALAESSRRNAVQEWAWNGTDVIVAPGRPLPPWERLRLHSAAYGRALDELIGLLAAQVCPPPWCRVIFDWGDGMPLVVESDDAGAVWQPYRPVVFANTCGEADMAAQRYAFLARCGEEVAQRPHGLAVRPTDAQFGGAAIDDAGEVLALMPPTLRPLYEAGSVVLHSTDTDYLPLSMLHWTLHDRDIHSVFLAMGTCHVRASAAAGGPLPAGAVAPAPQEFCTKTTAGAVAKGEVYDVRKLCVAAHELAGPDVPVRDAVARFVAFCVASGNDYVPRRYGLTHRTMFQAFRRAPLRVTWTELPAPGGSSGDGGSGSVPVARVDADEWREWVRQCYWQRLPAGSKGPAAGPATPEAWAHTAALVNRAFAKPAARMPSPDELQALHHTFSWALGYACTGPHGHASVSAM